MNDVIFSHLLKYNSELANFLNSAEDALRNKCNEIWRCVYSLTEVANCSPQAGLALVLQTLNWLPSIPLDLSYHVGIPMMFAYGPELYELHSWGAAGNRYLLLDNHTWAVNLLSCKLACMHGGAGSNKSSHSRASTASSVAHHLPASSNPGTPSFGTNTVKSCSDSASSHGSQTAKLKLPAGSGNECSEDSKSICQDDSETTEEGGDNYEDEAPEGEGEHTNTQSSTESDSDTRESSSQSSSSETNGEIQACVVLPAKESQGDASGKGDKADAPKSPHPSPQSDTNDQDSKKEQKCQHHKDAWLLDKNFSMWCAHMMARAALIGRSVTQ